MGMGRIAAALMLLAVMLPSRASAAAVEVCNPTQKDSESFCVTYNADTSTKIASKPFGVDLSIADSSTNFSSDKNQWIDTVKLDFLKTSGKPATITPTDSMPDHLR